MNENYLYEYFMMISDDYCSIFRKGYFWLLIIVFSLF